VFVLETADASKGRGSFMQIPHCFSKAFMSLLATAFALTLVSCSANSSPNVTHEVRKALEQAGFSNISVSQDREKNVLTLKGDVNSESDKEHAQSIAKSAAGTAIVADEIGVRPKGDESTAKKVDSELDAGIDKNLEAMLVQHRLDKEVKYDVSNGVVTLKGDVPTQSQRSSTEKMAKSVPNVKQVVNELEIKHPPATSSN
jgi:hyperosmotically inducible periplasmic protein